jgi:hypothetical protein
MTTRRGQLTVAPGFEGVIRLVIDTIWINWMNYCRKTIQNLQSESFFEGKKI